MKIKVGILGLFFSTMVLHSQIPWWTRNVVVPMEFTMNVNAYAQSSLTHVSESSVLPPPIKYSMGTKTLLSYLAIAEYNAGNYATTNFPAGSSLVLMEYPLEYPKGRFVVMQAGEVICEVSNVLTFTVKLEGGNIVRRGSLDGRDYNSINYFYLNHFTGTYIAEIRFSGTPYGLGLDFFVEGLVVESGNSVPKPGENSVTEIWTMKIANAAGTGLLSGNHDIYLTGSISARGSKKIDLPFVKPSVNEP